MYQQIIDELKDFLTQINIPADSLNPDVFQGVFVKKLSNQNIIKDKRRINIGETDSTVNQTHIDITGRDSMLFFFEELRDTTTPTQSIDIDLYDNNLRYLNAIDIVNRNQDHNNNTIFTRHSAMIPADLINQDKLIYSSAYKKYGHEGEQVQINIPDSDETFTQLQRAAFQNDALVMLRYDYLHYLAILMPVELCDHLYYITNTHGNYNVNFPVLNPAYNADRAHNIQHERIIKDAMFDEIDAEILQHSLTNNPIAGTDIKKIAKARVAQGAFRRLLLLERHQCRLCDITATSVLRASHIKEWVECSREERIDSNNGLLLCANHDALFDRHLISFEPDSGQICISSSLDDEQRQTLNLSDAATIVLPAKMQPYMRRHHQKFTSKENS
ncbi:MAG: HNH endonuclease [Eubacterium sp.]|nr:HNH endonuclease [Eubacterium sp.]